MRPLDATEIDHRWTLFLDRDGVINKRLDGDYVKHYDDFEFIDGVQDALVKLASVFDRIVIVTNQQGIGKGLMTERGLFIIHEHMMADIHSYGGRVDAIFYCPELAEDDPECRKPNTGMAMEAKERFPEIDFKKSVMVGDSPTDMEFGERLGMHNIFIGESDTYESYSSLIHFARRITS